MVYDRRSAIGPALLNPLMTPSPPDRPPTSLYPNVQPWDMPMVYDRRSAIGPASCCALKLPIGILTPLFHRLSLALSLDPPPSLKHSISPPSYTGVIEVAVRPNPWQSDNPDTAKKNSPSAAMSSTSQASDRQSKQATLVKPWRFANATLYERHRNWSF
jgi:hypothetical protein